MTATDALDPIRIGLVSVSDRASAGVYVDQGLPTLQAWLHAAVRNPVEWVTRLVADERPLIADTLRALADDARCHLVLTTGGTGPAPRDVTPDATLDIADRVMPGFGEQMRQIGLHFVPTAILSRQMAVVRGQCLIVNLPGQPKSIAETLAGLPAALPPVPGIFAAVPYCVDLIGGPYIETDDAVCAAFRPKSARRPSATPATPATPGIPDSPATPDTLDTPAMPDTPRMPATSDVPDTPATLDTPAMPDNPATPAASG